MRTMRFNDGHEITTKLEVKEVMTRMNRLNTLRVLTEGYTDGEGRSICDKALRAYDKKDNFYRNYSFNFLRKGLPGISIGK